MKKFINEHFINHNAKLFRKIDRKTLYENLNYKSNLRNQYSLILNIKVALNKYLK